MSQCNSLLNETWGKLSNALERIFQFPSMSREEYMTLQKVVERYFQSYEYNDNFLQARLNWSKHTKESDKNVKQTDDNGVDTNIPGGELYFNVKKFFKEYLENIATNGNNLQGEDFLRFYAKTWEKYQFSSKIANGLLAIMNTNWISRQDKEGIKGIYDIYTVAMRIWQDIFFKEPTQSLTQTCLHLINEERNGRRIDSILIRQVVQSYVSAGFTKSGENNRLISASLETYIDYFEKQFLQETEQFYQLESKDYMEKNSTNDYIKKVTQRLKEEEDRVKDYLHPTTLEKLKPMLDRILIKAQLEPIYSKTSLK